MSAWDGTSWPFGKTASFFVGVSIGAFATTAIALAVMMWVLSPGGVDRTPVAGDVQAASGEAIAAAQGCTACHSLDGSALTGPTWAGLAGSERTLSDGSTVVADADYLRRAIVDPRAEIVQGFAATIMPPGYGETLSPSEVNQVVTYIQSVGG